MSCYSATPACPALFFARCWAPFFNFEEKE
jgi:hypothetical protein